MKTRSLLFAATSLVCCLSAEARFDSSPFQNVPKSSRSTPAPAPTPRRTVDDGEERDSRPAKTRKTPKHDRRVKAALDAESMKYLIKDNGNFTLTMSWETDGVERSHVVAIQSETQSLASFEIRQVWAMGQKDCHLPRAELANVLAMNEKYKIGAWSIVRSSDGDESLIFTAKVPANLPAESLVGVLWAVAKTADEHEQKYIGTDDL